MRFASKAALAVGFTLASGPGAFAADLPRKATSPAPYSWTGLYAGLNAGYGWATSSGTTAKSAIGGAQAGYNWQTGNVVLGIETDIQATGQKATTTASAGGVTITETDKASWLGTTRLRAGWAADRWFFYGTGGVAYAKFKQDGTASGLLVGSYSGTNTKVGWTAGAGVEAAIANNWSWKLEYLYASFGGFTNTYALTGGSITINYPRINENIVRTGLNYRF
jgi:outer membrane immunogenic protein